MAAAQLRMDGCRSAEGARTRSAGTIARTCAATGVGLHLVGPLGYELDDKKLKRAGLDYWDYVAVRVHTDWAVRMPAATLCKSARGCFAQQCIKVHQLQAALT